MNLNGNVERDLQGEQGERAVEIAEPVTEPGLSEFDFSAQALADEEHAWMVLCFEGAEREAAEHVWATIG